VIVWNPNGFHLINILSKDSKLIISYYDIQIRDLFTIWWRIQVGRMNRKLIVYVDNMCLHTARITLDFMSINTIGRVPNLWYSPNRPPCNFYLFDYVNKSVIKKEIRWSGGTSWSGQLHFAESWTGDVRTRFSRLNGIPYKMYHNQRKLCWINNFSILTGFSTTYPVLRCSWICAILCNSRQITFEIIFSITTMIWMLWIKELWMILFKMSLITT
jgi:hypothetical protein